MEDIVRDLADLTPEELAHVRDYVAFLRWQSEQTDRARVAGAAHRWEYNFLEHFSEADVRATRGERGMEVMAAEATVGGERRPALWEHPPVQGEALVEFHVPVPDGLQDLRLRFATGIRDGAETDERLVAFRVRIAGWQVWSRACWPNTWEEVEVRLPFHAGDVLRIGFATDCLGAHPFAWAVWGSPVLIGEASAPEATDQA